MSAADDRIRSLESGGIELDPEWLAFPWIHGWTTADGPDFSGPITGGDHLLSVRQVATACGLRGLAWTHQVHGGKVLQATKPGPQGDADALWTDRPGLGVLGRGADCPLILVGGPTDDGRHVWGFAHASWRSTVARIAAGLVGAMSAAGGKPEHMRALVCPSAGPCCYEVGEEVLAQAEQELGAHARRFFIASGSSWIFDLWKANADQLQEAGVPKNAIRFSNRCTICHPQEYPSYRRQGDRAGRMGAWLGRALLDEG